MALEKTVKIHSQLAESLKYYRKAAGLTQAEVAEKAGINLNFYGQIERTTRTASLETVEKLAGALEISVGSLFSRYEKKAGEKQKSYSIGRQMDYICKEFTRSDKKLVLNLTRRLAKNY